MSVVEVACDYGQRLRVIEVMISGLLVLSGSRVSGSYGHSLVASLILYLSLMTKQICNKTNLNNILFLLLDLKFNVK